MIGLYNLLIGLRKYFTRERDKKEYIIFNSLIRKEILL